MELLKFKQMMPLLLLNIKDYVVMMLESKKSMFRFNDPIVKFLKLDHITANKFEHNVKMLPLELIESFGVEVLRNDEQYRKYYRSDYDIFQQLWDKHYEEYENDRIELYELYMNSKCDGHTPVEMYNKLNDLMIKIERRSLMLGPQWTHVFQKQTRQSGDEKEYKFIRAHWVDDKGQKKRMVNRLVGEKHENLEKEVGILFHNMGYAVHRNVKVNSNVMLDMVIERDKQRIAVEVKAINEDTFDKIFLFDDLVRRFNENYPNG